MKKLYAFICTLLVALCGTMIVPLISNGEASQAEAQIATITEIGNPTIAGPGNSYYDDGVLYYTSTGNTIGYNYDHSNTIFDFDIMFNTLAFPSWFSLTLKASGCDRTQSPNLEQKGYSFVFFPAGTVQVWKDGATLVSTAVEPINCGTKYNIKLGAVNDGNNVRLSLVFDGHEIINQVDSQNAYLNGNWFNICSDGSVSANLISTKKVVYPDYYTYTMSTIGSYPLKAGAPIVDKYNNVYLQNSGETIGFNQALQNFSLEMNFNFTTFEWPANFWISARTKGFDRVLSANLEQKGYSFRLNAGGVVEIYKETASLGSANVGGFAVGQNYIVEIGVVDIDENTTNLFLSVNNQVVISVNDSEDPIQSPGFINMNGDGNVALKITSSNSKITPLQTTVEKNEKIVLTTHFLNTISYTALEYTEFGERNLRSILLDDVSVYDINANYYALSGQNRIRAVEVKCIDNKLIIEIAKTFYSNSGIEQVANYKELTIKKTAQNSGLKCPSGFVLKQTYYVHI